MPCRAAPRSAVQCNAVLGNAVQCCTGPGWSGHPHTPMYVEITLTQPLLHSRSPPNFHALSLASDGARHPGGCQEAAGSCLCPAPTLPRLPYLPLLALSPPCHVQLMVPDIRAFAKKLQEAASSASAGSAPFQATYLEEPGRVHSWPMLMLPHLFNKQQPIFEFYERMLGL